MAVESTRFDDLKAEERKAASCYNPPFKKQNLHRSLSPSVSVKKLCLQVQVDVQMTVPKCP